jgi:DNA-binding LytR/AlgR family response regulator
MKTTYSSSGIIIEDGRKCYILPYDEIQWIKSEDNYCMLYTKNAHILVRQSLNDFQAHLKPLFFRCHRTIIVNILFIDIYDKKTKTIHLKTGVILPVARTLHKTFLKRLYDLSEYADN